MIIHSVFRFTVTETMPVSFFGNVNRQKQTNDVTLTDTGFLTL